MRWCVCFVLFVSLLNAAMAEIPTKMLSKLFEDCSRTDWETCLKVKLATTLDGLRESKDIKVIEGLTLVANRSDSDASEPMTEKALQESLPRQAAARQQLLDALLADKFSNFVSKYSLRWNLANISSTLDEGRGKKKYGHMLMLPLMMAASFLPIALGTLALLAGKALIVGKMALLLVSILGVRKLFSNGADDDHQRAMKRISDFGMRLKTDMMAHKMAYRGQMPTDQNADM